MGLNWQAMSARGLGPGRPLRSAISDASSAERSFVPNDAVGRDRVALLDEALRVEDVDGVQVGSRVVDAVTRIEARGPDCLNVPLLRADDEDVSHSSDRGPAREWYRLAVGLPR